MSSRKPIKTLRLFVCAVMIAQFAFPVFVAAESNLEVDFFAEPTLGVNSLENVDLTAIVSGTATGPITYKFDCTKDGTWERIVTTNDESLTAADLCDYSSPGNYTAKVSVGRGGLFFEGTTAVMVSGTQNLTVTLSASPSSGMVPLRDVDLKAVVSGSSNEEITYRFDCTDDGDWEREVTINQTTYTAADLCDYEDVGSHTARVKIERGGLSFSGITTIAVFREGEEQAEGVLSVTKNARNITKNGVDWKTSVDASPGDIIAFRIQVRSSQESLDNVTVKDILPAGMVFAGKLQIDGSSSSGNIESGINLGELQDGDEKTITFEAKVNAAESFAFGTTTLTNMVSVTAQNAVDKVTVSSAKIRVTRSGVLGAATSVSTGITDYLYGLFITLFLLALMLYALWRKVECSKNGLAGAFARKFYLWRAFVRPR